MPVKDCPLLESLTSKILKTDAKKKKKSKILPTPRLDLRNKKYNMKMSLILNLHRIIMIKIQYFYSPHKARLQYMGMA